jgi:hypothetical protein
MRAVGPSRHAREAVDRAPLWRDIRFRLPHGDREAWRDYCKGRLEARTPHSHNGVVAE